MTSIHLAAAVLSLLVGAAVLARTKGTPSHKLLGRVWVGLMLAVALSSFWIFDLRKGAGPSVIHLLSAWTLISLGLAVYFIRRGLAGAGLGALAPGRLLAQLLLAGRGPLLRPWRDAQAVAGALRVKATSTTTAPTTYIKVPRYIGPRWLTQSCSKAPA